MSRKIIDYVFYVCSILLVLSAGLYMNNWTFIPYVYAVSAVGVSFAFLASPYRGENRRLRRLNIQQAIGAILLPISAYFMFQKMSEWFICLFVAAILLGYTLYIHNREYEDEEEE